MHDIFQKSGRKREHAGFQYLAQPWKELLMKSVAVPQAQVIVSHYGFNDSKLELGNPDEATRQMVTKMWCLLRDHQLMLCDSIPNGTFQ